MHDVVRDSLAVVKTFTTITTGYLYRCQGRRGIAKSLVGLTSIASRPADTGIMLRNFYGPGKH